MSSARIHPRNAASGLLALWALTSSCSLQHGEPEAGDTVTNWLWHCGDDDDCTGGASCLHARCTMACAAPRASVCARLSTDAVCDVAEQACDLPCTSAASCHVLGADYRCEAGRCRAPADDGDGVDLALDSGIDEQSAALAIPVSVEVEQSTDGPTRGVFSAAVEGSFDPEAMFSPNDPATQIGQPITAWHGDHFFVGWTADAYTRPGSRVDLAEVYASGRYSVRRLEVPNTSWLTFHQDGYLMAHPDVEADGKLHLRITDLQTGQTSAPLLLDTNGSSMLAGVPGSRDWLITWSLTDWNGGLTSVITGRLRSDEPALVAGPWQIARLTTIWTAPTAATGGDGFLLFPTLYDGIPQMRVEDSVLRRLEGLATTEALKPDYVPRVESWPVAEGSVEFVATTGERVHVLTVVGEALMSSVLTRDGHMSREIELALPPPEERPSYASLPSGQSSSAVYAPEIARLGVCAVVHSGVWFLILDAQGQMVDAPLALQTNGWETGQRRISATACDIAWSGEQFLVVWKSDAYDVSPEAPLISPPPPIYSLRARMIDASSLAL